MRLEYIVAGAIIAISFAVGSSGASSGGAAQPVQSSQPEIWR